MESEKPKDGEAPPETAPEIEADADIETGGVDVELAETDVEESVVTRPAPPVSPGPQIMLRRRFIPPTQNIEFTLSPPILDPDRAPRDVSMELDQRAYEFNPYQIMRQSIRDLRDSRMNTLDTLRRRQSVIFLNLILYPFIDGLAEELMVSPDEQVRTMVRRGQTIGSLIARNRETAETILNKPQIRIWGGLVRPVLDSTDEEIRSKENIDWWMDVIKRTRLEFYQVLDREANGRWWLAESLVETLNFLKGILTQ